jgi:hypothetical protein
MAQGVHGVNTAFDGASVTELSLRDRFDVRPFFDTLRARWWVLPVAIVVAVGLLWVQESDLQSSPDAYSLTRTFEVSDPLPTLALVGLDPTGIRAVPDLESQVVVLRGDDVRQRIADTLGYEPSVSIVRSTPTFSLIDTTDSDGRSIFTFRSSGIPTLIFTCNETVRDRCPDVLDAYVAEAAKLRAEALAAGLERGRALLGAALAATPDDARLKQQIAAIDDIISDSSPTYRLISSEEQTYGATVATVATRTYVFGAAAGLLIGLLVILQWSLVDNTIRSVQRLRRAIGTERVLGTVKHDASALETQLARAAISRVGSSARLIPLSAGVRSDAFPGAPMTAPLAELVPAASQGTEVIVVQRGKDRVSTLLTALTGLQRAGHQVAGVVLLD